MSEDSAPEWFTLTEQATKLTMNRLAIAVKMNAMPLQVKYLPMQAHWFILDSLLLANRANRDGMHANALALTRQCIEALSIIELGLSRHPEAARKLHEWESDDLSPGALRKWLSDNLWESYGCGLWTETWAEFMRHFAGAVQPYAHYTTHLAKWQLRLHGKMPNQDDNSLVVEYRPRAYDAQKATRITLFRSILTFVLGRIVTVSFLEQDPEFSALINRLRVALGKSKYLDGHQTN